MPVSRRQILTKTFNGFGALALADMLSADVAAAVDPLAPKKQHMKRKAKHCIFLFMVGGVSQMDSFDPKPELKKYDGKRLPKLPGLSGEVATFLDAPHRVVPGLFEFKRHGQTGREISSIFPHIAESADDLAFIHGIKVDNNNHGPATLHLSTGSQFQGNASVGSWIGYGLGTLNRDLPGYVVIRDPKGAPVTGSSVWNNGFLPASYQGTLLRSTGAPILDLGLPSGVSRQQQRTEFDYIKWMNEKHASSRTGVDELEARISAYELAFRMQTEAPKLVDMSRESTETGKLYGLDKPATAPFGRQCLLARKMVEAGVRFTLVTHGYEISTWDHHANVEGRMRANAAEVDQPVGALLKDLKARGLLDETLVVWASEMGRTPFVSHTRPQAPGREHNQYGLTMWMAGGDVKGGGTAGQMDEFGLRSVGEEVHMRDVHATLLNLMGLRDQQLTYLHAGRYRKLTDIGGKTLSAVIAG